ncbi:MAG: molybdate ABC transporter substrate-binding protein [Acetobacterales bacterium]
MLGLVRCAVVLALAAGGWLRPAAATEPVTVFAAASLTDALQAVGETYEKKNGTPLRLSFASSSILARQIEAGAPAQIFASANERWMDYLAQRDLIVTSSRVSPVANRLVLVDPVAARTPPVSITPSLDLAGMLGADRRLAVGDPEHVPAGIYAKQALESLGLWEALEPRLARADNVRAALALVARGEAPYGIVYATDTRIDPEVAMIGGFPPDSHPPITYPFAIVAGQDSPEVREAFAFMTGAESRRLFEQFGFAPGNEQ